jgi:hypothetical protein
MTPSMASWGGKPSTAMHGQKPCNFPYVSLYPQMYGDQEKVFSRATLARTSHCLRLL